jgi:dTDP-4-amino-4,6-dideoxygalactose transaminase
MVATNDPDRAARMRRLANHGVTKDLELLEDHALALDENDEITPWYYEQIELGFNYRMNELEAALGLSQLAKLDLFVRRRRTLASLYDLALEPLTPTVRAVRGRPGDRICPHLHQVLIDFDGAGVSRSAAMRGLAARGIGTQVHYIPVYRQPYFARRYGVPPLVGAEAFYAGVLALPLFPAMRNEDVQRVASALGEVLGLA